jgi:hypothetical protein
MSTTTTGPVVLSAGMGVDSTAILVRWLLEPSSRWFDLRDLVVLTAMTGDEYPATEHLMTTYALPLMAEHKVRYVQVARAGQSDRSGYVVLSDSATDDEPWQRMHMVGPWRLSDEMRANGVIPQTARNRRTCSQRAKKMPLEGWIRDHLGGRPYTHCLGFAADEPERILRDASYATRTRDACFPLDDWNMSRADAASYIQRTLGVTWSRSCCVYCPFQAPAAHLHELVQRWRDDPASGADAVLLEHTALALNPRSMLFGRRTARQLVDEHQLREVDAIATARLSRQRYCLYDVRRVFRAKHGDPNAKARGPRQVRRLAIGSHHQMRRALRRIGDRLDQPTRTDGGHYRVWFNEAAGPYPAAERFIALAPAGVLDKTGPGFHAAWRDATSTDRQLALFDIAE